MGGSRTHTKGLGNNNDLENVQGSEHSCLKQEPKEQHYSREHMRLDTHSAHE